MRRTRQDLPILLQHPRLWRQQLLPALMNRGWWLSSRLAATYRRTAAKGTHVVAVVGSLGKTTTTRAVSAALGYKLPLWYQRGFNNAYYSVALRILEIQPFTPRAVVEVGIIHPGQMAPIAQMLRPDITVVTAIGSDHCQYLRTLEVTRTEKSEMVRVLLPSGTAVLNGDDPNVLWMRGQTRARVITFGFNPGNDIRADSITLQWPEGMRFRLHAFGETRNVSIRLLGRHMVYPILAAVAVASVVGLPLDQVLAALASLPPTPGRLRPVRLDDGTIILQDDSKGSLEAIKAALDLLAEIPNARRGILLGDMQAPPENPDAGYEYLGQQIAEIASFAIFHGDTPAVQGYLKGVTRGGLPPERTVQARGSVLEAVSAVREQLEPGDVLLCKGRGGRRLERAVIALQGRMVRCDVLECRWGILCEHCPRLDRDWG